MKVYIYILKCPITNQVKYVGKTTESNLKKRISYHTKRIKSKPCGNCDLWTNEMIFSKIKPIFEIVDECSEENWSIFERFWVRKYREDGSTLLNITDGGDGFNGPITENHISSKLKGKKLVDIYSIEKIEYLLSIRSLKGDKNSNFGGANHTPEYLKKQVVSNSKKPLLVIDTKNGNKEYIFINSFEAADFIKCKDSNIRSYKNKSWKIKRRYIIKDMPMEEKYLNQLDIIKENYAY